MHSSGRGGGKEGQIPIVGMICCYIYLKFCKFLLCSGLYHQNRGQKLGKNLGKDFLC